MKRFLTSLSIFGNCLSYLEKKVYELIIRTKKIAKEYGIRFELGTGPLARFVIIFIDSTMGMTTRL